MLFYLSVCIYSSRKQHAIPRNLQGKNKENIPGVDSTPSPTPVNLAYTIFTSWIKEILFTIFFRNFEQHVIKLISLSVTLNYAKFTIYENVFSGFFGPLVKISVLKYVMINLL